MHAVELVELKKKYQAVTALDGLSLTIACDQIFGFLGPDGAGKTSLFRILCGILTPSAGRAVVLGHDVVRAAETLKRELGYMAQKFALYADLTVQENLDFFADIFQAPYRGLAQKRDELLRFAGLLQFKERLAGNLSGGMKQKLALCCTLIHTPRILILDEPTTGVDPVSRQEFWEMLLPLPGRGTTIIVSTAYMDEAAKCDRLTMLNEGRILTVGSPDELQARLADRVWEVRGEPRAVIYESLQGCPLVKQSQIYGDRIHIQLRPDIVAAQALEDITALLGTAGFQVEIQAIVPSMEDVFIDLMGG